MDDFVNGISHSSCEYKRSECLLDFVPCVGSVDEYIRWKCVQITENHSYRLLIGINVTHSRKNWYFRWLYPILRSYFRRCEANECAGIKVSWNKNFWHINNIDGISWTMLHISSFLLLLLMDVVWFVCSDMVIGKNQCCKTKLNIARWWTTKKIWSTKSTANQNQLHNFGWRNFAIDSLSLSLFIYLCLFLSIFLFGVERELDGFRFFAR